ncbi:DUF2905 domain-containing protein [Geoalkalibacter sp.]|uniref:DUF2905 domain-containing protein n=1 Tax=Geoalkalibacter sp. TaxID=3041440 RepID=UPI00272E8357|nr:DUF2905 domain-containing protein [Geoalkalibacter sp.]
MHPGKLLILLGVLLILAGLLYTWGGKIPLLGRLPGDIRLTRDHFSFYFPLGTCILISVLLSLVFWLFRR